MTIAIVTMAIVGIVCGLLVGYLTRPAKHETFKMQDARDLSNPLDAYLAKAHLLNCSYSEFMGWLPSEFIQNPDKEGYFRDR